MATKNSDTSVEALRASGMISIRVYYALQNLGVDDIRQLESIGMEKLRNTRGWGTGMLHEIDLLVKGLGLSL